MLLRGIAAGEVGSLAALYDRYAQVAWQAALHWGRDEAAAEALVTAAFLGLWRQPNPCDPRTLDARVLAAVRAEALGGSNC